MAKLGMPRQALVPILAFAFGDKLDKEHQRFLLGPIIQHKSQWKDTTPDWMYEGIGYDRLNVIFNEHAQGKVGWEIGPIELATVMYPATMEAPMRHEYAQIYLWASAKASAYHRDIPEEKIWEMLGISEVKEEEITDPKGQFHYAYRELCSDIRRKVVKNGAELERQLRTPDNKPKGQAPNSPNILGDQLSLF